MDTRAGHEGLARIARAKFEEALKCGFAEVALCWHRTMHLLRTFVRYNVWATERLLASVATLDDAVYHGHCGLPFRSIHGTLNHILLADKLLYSRLQPDAPEDPRLAPFWNRPDNELYAAPNAPSTYWEEFVPGRDAIAAELVGQAKRLVAHVDTVPASDARVAYRATDGVLKEKEAGYLILHAVNHATHHRGQISASLTRLDVPPPTMDFSYFTP
ncbi:hypothetical protein SDRG_07808 [Saprolegnia diclina VS20]|uniref:DinB-like domain-containing protein n=1 Tax=Saprolegnia diclina (strain VS20) TaxID=1156394 RepID=T0QL18_SAPDV|nr:hypothetical protein SDRG_07808 [Saprolegnia diclina VS20]EQC34480.1 hypothetical protein SDRG_07808 [Saprolegnia diclina VS20]|eukprot:XP_008611886.1 hypothetical protein SDRG_07808 [Saprolegnia diclina VS20]